MAYGWDDLAGAGVQTLLNIGQGAVNNLFGNYARKKNAEQSFKSYVNQALLDYRMASGPYFDLAQRYNEANYDLARRYSENSASWAVTGLRNAGLNPILAASQGFNAQTGGQGVQSSSSSSGAPSYNQSSAVHAPDILEGLRDMSAARLTDANAKLVDKQAQNIEAQTAETLIEAINKAKTRGLSGNIGGLAGLLNTALSDITGTTGSTMIDSVIDDATTRFANDIPSVKHLPDEQKRAWQKKAGEWLSDIIKSELAKRRRADFQNHYNHMMHGNGVLHMGH